MGLALVRFSLWYVTCSDFCEVGAGGEMKCVELELGTDGVSNKVVGGFPVDELTVTVFELEADPVIVVESVQGVSVYWKE